VFGVSAAVILLYHVVRFLSGSTTEQELITIKESDEHS
jgi:hypothetical protein